jgi:hypothetical protein
MSAPIQQFLCPGCSHEVQEQWVACPVCGLRLKPATELLPRIVAWGGVLIAFVSAVLLIARHDQDAAAGFAVVTGLPLCYIFGKAVLFRLQGQPLTWKQLGQTSVRTFLVGFGLLVVAPALIGAALIILLLAVCGGMLLTGRF